MGKHRAPLAVLHRRRRAPPTRCSRSCGHTSRTGSGVGALDAPRRVLAEYRPNAPGRSQRPDEMQEYPRWTRRPDRLAIALLAVLTMPGCPGDKCDRDLASPTTARKPASISGSREERRCGQERLGSGQRCSGVETVDGDKVSDSGTCVEPIARVRREEARRECAARRQRRPRLAYRRDQRQRGPHRRDDPSGTRSRWRTYYSTATVLWRTSRSRTSARRSASSRRRETARRPVRSLRRRHSSGISRAGSGSRTSAISSSQRSTVGWVASLARMSGAAPGVRALREAGHEIHFVTSPWPGHATWVPEARRVARASLRREARRITFTHHQRSLPRRLVFVDDKPEHVEAYTRGVAARVPRFGALCCGISRSTAAFAPGRPACRQLEARPPRSPMIDSRNRRPISIF